VFDAAEAAGLSPERGNDGVSLSLTGYAAGQLRFDVIFVFAPNSGGLMRISLDYRTNQRRLGVEPGAHFVTIGEVRLLREALISKYSEPASSRSGIDGIWKDEPGNNVISLICVALAPGLHCRVEYKPLRSREAGEL